MGISALLVAVRRRRAVLEVSWERSDLSCDRHAALRKARLLGYPGRIHGKSKNPKKRRQSNYSPSALWPKYYARERRKALNHLPVVESAPWIAA